MGTCVPSEILGPRGTLPANNSSLLSLSLTTDPDCQGCGEPGCEIDLSALRQLRTLRWRAPGAHHFDALSLAIENNSERLQSLELDFVSWAHLRDELRFERDDYTQYSWCVNKVFGLTRQSPQLIFPAIRELCLAHVPLDEALAPAINFDTLVSLKLRNCRDWFSFLGHVMDLGRPIRLKTFEVRDGVSCGPCGFGHEIVEPFLRTFEGLEELFVSYWNSTKGDYVGRWNSVTSELWDRAVHHRATLRRLAYHMRETEWRGPENDVLDEGLYSWAAGQTEEGPSQHPFASLDLDFIGLSCVPELLVSTRRCSPDPRSCANHNTR